MNKNVYPFIRIMGLIAVAAILALVLWTKLQDIQSSQMVVDKNIQPKGLLKSLESAGEVLLRQQGKGAVFLSAEESRNFFLENLEKWVAEEESPEEVPTPELTLYLNLAENYKVHFYSGELERAMIQQNNHYRYFKIPKGTYEKMAFDYSIRSYLVAEPLIEAIGEGKLTNKESVNDTPNNVNYKAAQVGNMQFYFYKKSGKYYIEAPYFFIKELNKDVYERAIIAIPQ